MIGKWVGVYQKKKERRKERHENFLKSDWMNKDLTSLPKEELDPLIKELRINYLSRFIGGLILLFFCIVILFRL